MRDLEEFENDYTDAADDVSRAKNRMFAERLRQWWGVVDAYPPANALIGSLVENFDFDAWYRQGLSTVGGMVGSGHLDWSVDPSTRLAQNVGLFRFLAERDTAFADFSSNFLWAGKHLDDSVAKISDQLFEPFARDLLKAIKRSAQAVPAADRIVSLDHNSQKYSEVVDALEKLEVGLAQSNSLAAEHPKAHSQIIAEIGAGRRLLNALQIRRRVAWDLLSPALTWVVQNVGATAFGVAVTAIIAILASTLGISIPGL